MLERLFAAEVDAAVGPRPSPIVHVNNATIRALAEQGLAQPATETLGGRFPVTISGYVLTELGRMVYCMTCEDEDDTGAGSEGRDG